MNIEDRAVLLWLDALLKTGLMLNYDPTMLEIDEASLVEISPSGRQHYFLGNWQPRIFLCHVPGNSPLSESTFMEMRDKSRESRWRDRTAIFIDYLLREDVMYCGIPDHEAYESQARIQGYLRGVAERLHGIPSSAGPRRSRFTS